MIKEHVFVELKQFIYALSNHRGVSKNITSTQLVRSSINLLQDLPAAREIVLEYFALVFDKSVENYVSFITKDTQEIPPEDEAINDIQETLENLVTKGPTAWCSLIASWSLDVVGKLSDKYWPSRKLDIGAACNFWLNCGAVRCLLGLISSCFRKLTNLEAEICVGTLLTIFRKYSTTFDWVVARLGGCFPFKIISQIFQCGLKRFSEDCRCRLDSEIGILDYLCFAHETDLKHAIKELLEEGFNMKNKYYANIVPYIMQIVTSSEVILQSTTSVFLEIYNDNLLDVIVQQTSLWMQNLSFREMQPSLNNVALKIRSNGAKLLLIIAKLAEKYSWCQDFIEYTLQELEQCVLLKRTCPLLTDLGNNESKSLLWRYSVSSNFLEQQTAIRLLLLVSTNYPHIYHQTICELLLKSYEVNKSGLGALIRIIGGLPGLVAHAEVKPGIAMALERVLMQKQFRSQDKQSQCNNVIKNLVTLARLEKGSSTPFLKQQPITQALNECLLDLLNILDCVLSKLFLNTELEDPLTVKERNIKRIKAEDIEEDCETSTDSYGSLIHTLIHLLNTIEAGSKYSVVGMIEVLKLAQLSVKYFFWSLTEKSKTMRSISTNRIFTLLQRQCSVRKAARAACLRDLVEGALFYYSHLFGASDDFDMDEADISENEQLMLLNQKQGLGPNANRSVLHAGIIGKGLKIDPISESSFDIPNSELQRLLLKAIDSCCQDQERANTIDGYSTVSLLLVEMVSSDIMYNGLPFPEEEFTKVTMERDLQIRRTFRMFPILWGILGLVSNHRPALCFSSVLLRALCASFLYQWRAKNVNKFQAPDRDDELLIATKRLLQILAMGQLLPHPLNSLHMIIEHLEPPEIALVLKECVWNYLKDNVPSPILFQCDPSGLHWRNPSTSKPLPQYVDTLRNIMQKKLTKLGSYYYQMFSLADLEKG